MADRKNYTTQYYTGSGASKGSAKYGPNMDFASNEAFNLLRTNVIFALGGKEGCKKIGVTSSVAGEGKTYIAINLAFSLAEAGFRTLLVDGDMRRSNLGARLKIENSPGLSNYIIDPSMKGVIRSSELSPQLFIVPAGDYPPNPSELLSSDRMNRVVDYFSQNVDYIVFDLPPVQAVADPLVTSRHLDGMIVVVRKGVSHRGELKDTIRQLKFVNVNILGVAYNGAEPSSSGKKYYRYGRYYNNYRYYSSTRYYTSAKAETEKTGSGK